MITMISQKGKFSALSIGVLCIILVLFAAGPHTSSVSGVLAATQPATQAPATPIAQSTEDPLVVTAVPTTTANEDPSLAARDVTIKVDDTHSVSQVMPYEGGVMTTTGTDGTKYTLTFAKGTVVLPTRITMTPFQSVTSQSGKTYPAVGVELGPNGLRLYMPADLLIEPAQPLPVDQQLSFSFEGSGQGTYRYPLDKDPKKILFHLHHFTGAGMIGAVGGAMQDLFSKALSSTPDTVQQRLLEQEFQAVQDARSGKTSTEDAFAQSRSLIEQYIQDVITPEVERLKNNPNPGDVDVDNVMYDLFTEMHDYGLLGGDTSFDGKYANLIEIIRQALDRVATNAIKDCPKGGHVLLYLGNLDFGWIINKQGAERILIAARIAALMGVSDYGKRSINDLIRTCRPAGFKFNGLILSQTATVQGGVVQLDLTLGAHACGPDPFAAKWTPLGMKASVTITASGTVVTKSVPFVPLDSVRFSKDSPTKVGRAGEVTMQLIPGNPTILRASAHFVGDADNFGPPANFSKAGPVDAIVEEDTTCPAPK